MSPDGEQRSPADAPMRGVAFMVAASASFAAMNAIASELKKTGLPWATPGFARAAVGLAVALAFARARGVSLAVRDGRVMWTRSLAGTAGMLCTFYSLSRLPLADATALLNTTPLWIALLAWIALREAAGWFVGAALLVASAGIALIQQPSIAAGNLAGLVALAAGASGALAMVSLRRLSGETPEAVVVHFSAVATGVMGAVLAWDVARRGGHPPVGAIQALGLLGVGLTATLGQLLLTRAYALDRAARVGAVGWIQIVFGLVIDVAIVRRAPPGTTVAGIALIVGAGALLLADARRDELRRRATAT